MPDADLAVGDLLEVRYEGAIAGSRWNNVLHAAFTTAPTNPEDIYENLAVLADTFHTIYSNALSPVLVADWSLNVTRVKRIKPTPSVFAFHAEILVGAESGGVDEPDDAAVARIYTSQSGRSHQGRIYIPGIPDSAVSGGYISEAVATELADKLATLLIGPITGPNSSVLHFYHWSPKLSNDGNPLTAAAWPIKRVFVDMVMRKLTRREVRVPSVIMGTEA